MSLADKQNYLRDLEHRLGDFVPANDVKRIIAEAYDSLSVYELQLVQAEAGHDPDSDDLLRYFLESMRVSGRSEKTINRYRYVLSRLAADTGIPLGKLTIYHIRSYLTSEQDRGISLTTLESNRQVYSSFYGWLAREGLITKNPVINLKSIKKPKVKKQAFSATELELLMRAAMDPNSSRNVAIICFLASTACRVSEVCQLNREDINLKDQNVKVYGKGGKERTVLFDDVTALYLSSYLAEREDDDPALFIGLRGRLEPGGVRYMLHDIGKKAGVENVHPHRFRRTQATHLIDAGMPIQEVAVLLGHDKIDTTMTYVCIDERNVAHDFRKYA